MLSTILINFVKTILNKLTTLSLKDIGRQKEDEARICAFNERGALFDSGFSAYSTLPFSVLVLLLLGCQWKKESILIIDLGYNNNKATLGGLDKKCLAFLS